MASDQLERLHERMRVCRLCLDAGHNITPGAVFTGQASARVMVIGQAPGVTEVAAKRPFNASSGRRLFQWLGDAGWDETDFRARHYMTAVTKCFPGKSASGRGDRVPSKDEQALCRPYLLEEVRLVNPRLIIPVGGLAIRLFYAASARLKQLIGRANYLPAETLSEQSDPFSLKGSKRLEAYNPALSQAGRWVVPLPHPSGASAWPNLDGNQALISRAVEILAGLREAWQL
ncbi:MAG: uracil-DNA glycosylase family protein [Chloroflexota bacterium]